MGTWGSGLYANDTTSDVRDQYTDLIRDGMEDAEAYQKIMEDFADYFGSDEEPLIWFALADTQWKIGRLTPDVREKAMEWIEKEGGMELWEESANKGSGWRKTLAKLKERLNSPMPARKKLRKPPVLNMNPWNMNDVYAYQFSGKDEMVENAEQYAGKYIVMQKVGERPLNKNASMIMSVQIFDKIFDTLPSLQDLEKVRILPTIHPSYSRSRKRLTMSLYLELYIKKDYPAGQLTYIGNCPPRPYLSECHEGQIYWSSVPSWTLAYMKFWKDLQYENPREGVYEFPDGYKYVIPDEYK